MQPVATIDKQVSGVDILAGCPTVLVDDTVYLVDDPQACIGSKTVTFPMRDIALTVDKGSGK